MKNSLITPTGFSADLLNQYQVVELSAEEIESFNTPGTLCIAKNKSKMVFYLVWISKDGLRDFLKIETQSDSDDPQARFDIEGLWGYYKNGECTFYPHGHEEGPDRIDKKAWDVWVREKIADIEQRMKESSLN